MADATVQAESADRKPRTQFDAIDDLDCIIEDMKGMIAAVEMAIDAALPADDAYASQYLHRIETYRCIMEKQLEQAQHLSDEIHKLGRA